MFLPRGTAAGDRVPFGWLVYRPHRIRLGGSPPRRPASDPLRRQRRRDAWFASWLAFLLFWHLSGLLTILYMMSGSFASSQRGLEIDLASTVTPAQIEDLKAGRVLWGPDGSILIDPNRHSWRLASSSRPELRAALDTFCSAPPDTVPPDRVLILRATDDALYQDVVTALDLAGQAGWHLVTCRTLLITSPSAGT